MSTERETERQRTTTDTTRELQFMLGTFFGMAISAFGLGFYFLALARGVSSRQTHYPEGMEIGYYPIAGMFSKGLLIQIGVLLFVAGLAARIFRSEGPRNFRNHIKFAGSMGLILGFALVSFALSPETNTDSPFFAPVATLPITLPLVLIGGAIFPISQLSRLKRGHLLVSRRQKRGAAVVGVALILVGVLPGVAFVGGVAWGKFVGGLTMQKAIAGGFTVLPVPAFELTGGYQKIVLFVVAFEMMFSGYAVVRTAASSVGW